MSLERLWAGWRHDFVTAASAQPTQPTQPTSVAPAGEEAAAVPEAGAETAATAGCVFCRILTSGVPDEESHILWRDADGLALAILNAYPYTSGHLMVMPVRHVAALEDLEAAEAQALWAGLTAGVQALKSAYGPDGINVGANLGRAAGAGVPGHLHLHALPRWIGDTNFMTTVADARVMPEALSTSDAKLRAAWPTPVMG